MTKKEMMENVQYTESKLIANNTVRYTDVNGNKIIRFHKTDIMATTKDGKTIIYAGDFRTATTKSRINDYLPPNFRLIAVNKVWKLEHNNIETGEKKLYNFSDFITIDKDVNVSNYATDFPILSLQKELNQYFSLVKNSMLLAVAPYFFPMLESNIDFYYSSDKITANKIISDIRMNILNLRILEDVKASFLSQNADSTEVKILDILISGNHEKINSSPAFINSCVNFICKQLLRLINNSLGCVH